MPSLPQALVDWAQVISAALSLLALAVALIAIWKSNRDIAKERRTTHELDVLRDLGEEIWNPGFDSGPRIRTCLFLLRDPEDLPMVRAAVDALPRDHDLCAFGRRYPEAAPLDDPEMNTSEVFRSRLGSARSDGTAAEELDQAIQRRLTH